MHHICETCQLQLGASFVDTRCVSSYVARYGIDEAITFEINYSECIFRDGQEWKASLISRLCIWTLQLYKVTREFISLVLDGRLDFRSSTIVSIYVAQHVFMEQSLCFNHQKLGSAGEKTNNLVSSRIIWCDWEQRTALCLSTGIKLSAFAPW